MPHPSLKLNSHFTLKRSATALGLFGVVFAFSVFSQTEPAPTPPPATPTPASFSLTISPQIVFTGDTVIVSAVPDNFATTTADFTWYRDGKKLDSASGVGRFFATIATDPTKQEVIQIRIQANPGPDFIPGEQFTAIYTLPSPAQQEETLSNIASSFSLRASATNPNPGEAVSVEVVTFAFDKERASYEWSINGARQRDASGQGKYRINIPGGKEGEEKTVSVTITTPAGDVRSDSVTIIVASTAFYWWADTSVPYWYKGKALPSLNSRVTVMALPNGRNPSNLNFQWQFNAAPIPQSSGFGRQAFSFTFEFPVEERIDVTMKDVPGTFSKTASIGVKSFSPSVGVYELRPLRGVVYERSLNEFSQRSGDKYDFLAAPFFFPSGHEKNLNYVWTLNGKQIVGTFTEPRRFTLTSNPGTESDNQLSVRVSDPGRNGGQTSTAIRAMLHQ